MIALLTSLRWKIATRATIASEVGKGIIRGPTQALAIADGTAEEGSYVVHTPEEIEARHAAKRREALAQENEPRLESEAPGLADGIEYPLYRFPCYDKR